MTDGTDDPDSPAAWAHLQRQDGWSKPEGATNDQAQLMATSMETWIAADPGALKAELGSKLREKALPPQKDLEARSPEEVFRALQTATKDAGRRRAYAKGRRSFQLLALVDPKELEQRLPHFRRLVATLRRP